MSKQRVVIIGGGITGLAAAFALHSTATSKTAVACTVLERSHRFGGKIKTDYEDGLVMELGPDSILARKPAGINLIRQLGVDAEVVNMNPAAGKTYMLHDDALEEMPAGTNMGVPTSLQTLWGTSLVSPAGKVRALLDLILPRAGHPSQDESLGLLLRRRLGNEWVTQVCEPLLAGIYAAQLDDLSAQSTFPQFRAILHQYRSLIAGSGKQRAAQRATAVGATNAPGRSTFITLRNGLQTLIEQLYNQLRDWADLRTHTEVLKIESVNNHYCIHILTAAGSETLDADTVIVTAPTYVAGQLLCSLSAKAATLGAIRYVSTATVVAGYGPGALNDLDGSGFLVPRSESTGITACTWTSNKWPHTATDNRGLIRCYVGRSGQQDALGLNDDALGKMVAMELQRIIGIKEQPWFTKVARWDKAMPQFEVGHKALVQDVEQQLELDAPGVFVAGAGYHGIGVPDCIESGQAAAAKAANWLRTNGTQLAH